VAARRVSAAAAARAFNAPGFDRDVARAVKRPRYCFLVTGLSPLEMARNVS
jgi:hypothetical protein